MRKAKLDLSCPKAFLLLVFIFAQILLTAQKVSKEGTLELKDGTHLEGIIIEQNDHFLIVIETGDTLAIDNYSIAFIKRMLVRPIQTNVSHHFDGAFFSLGYNHYPNDKSPLELSLLVGKRINKRVSFGVNLRLRKHKTRDRYTYVKPLDIYAGFYSRYYYTNSEFRSFVESSLGLSAPFLKPKNNYSLDRRTGGLQGSLGMGFQILSTYNWSFILKGGLTYSQSGLLKVDYEVDINGALIPSSSEPEKVSFSDAYPYIALAIEF